MRSVVVVRSGRRVQAAHAVLQVADDVIEADAAETVGRFVLASGIGDDHDGVLVIEDAASPGCVLARRARR